METEPRSPPPPLLVVALAFLWRGCRCPYRTWSRFRDTREDLWADKTVFRFPAHRYPLIHPLHFPQCLLQECWSAGIVVSGCWGHWDPLVLWLSYASWVVSGHLPTFYGALQDQHRFGSAAGSAPWALAWWGSVVEEYSLRWEGVLKALHTGSTPDRHLPHPEYPHRPVGPGAKKMRIPLDQKAGVRAVSSLRREQAFHILEKERGRRTLNPWTQPPAIPSPTQTGSKPLQHPPALSAGFSGWFFGAACWRYMW